MPELPTILVAGLTGLISGLLLSIPIGPINLTILNEGARRGFKWAALLGLGATAMEVIYCFIAFTSFASFFTHGYVKPAMQLFGFVFMSFIGIKFLLAKSVQARPVHLAAAADRIEARLQERLHPHSAFMTGLVRVMGNLGVLVFWQRMEYQRSNGRRKGRAFTESLYALLPPPPDPAESPSGIVTTG